MVAVIHVQVMTLRVKTFLTLFKCLILKTSYAFISFKRPKNAFRGGSCSFGESEGLNYTKVFSVWHL